MSRINGEKLVNLVGTSVYHPDFKNVLSELQHQIPVANQVNIDFLKIDKIWNDKFGIYLDFTTPLGYSNYTGEKPNLLFTDDKYELILKEVNFDDKAQERIDYPFSLAIGDNNKEIEKKLGMKPAKKYKSKGGGYHDGYIHYYYSENFQIITYLSDAKELLSLNIQILSVGDKKYLVEKPTVREQNASITDKNTTRIQKLKQSMPVVLWRGRMMKGDDSFTESSLKAAEAVMTKFIDDLCAATAEKNSTKVKGAIKKVVMAFNKLNSKHDYFIETLEREELAAYIQEAASLTGFIDAQDGDITEEWREW